MLLKKRQFRFLCALKRHNECLVHNGILENKLKDYFRIPCRILWILLWALLDISESTKGFSLIPSYKTPLKFLEKLIEYLPISFTSV